MVSGLYSMDEQLSKAPLRFLWIIDFEFVSRLHHGAYMRYFNFAPQMLAKGHSVTFVVNFVDSDRQPARDYFKELKSAGRFTEFFEIDFDVEYWRLKLSPRLVHPGLSNVVLRAAHKRFTEQIDALVTKTASDVVIVSSPRLFFVPHQSLSGCAFMYDLCDCQTLYFHVRRVYYTSHTIGVRLYELSINLLFRILTSAITVDLWFSRYWPPLLTKECSTR